MLTSEHPRPPVVPPQRLWPDAVRFGMPMAMTWCALLFLYWPGLMSLDSVDQWMQTTTGKFHDWHPAFHSLCIWLIRQVWDSPAAVATAQVLALSSVCGIGLAVCARTGTPRRVLWGSAVACALSPPVALMSITLWKDVPYAIALVGLTVIFVRLALTHGAWLLQPAHLCLLVLTSLCVASFRHNGPPVVLLSLGMALVSLRAVRRQLLIALAATTLLVAAIRGPLYSALAVDTSGAMHTILSHHVAAHLAAGHPVLQDDRHILQQIRPLVDRWDYLCTSQDPTIFHPRYDHAFAAAHTSDLLRIALTLAWANPLTEFQHTLCVGALVWYIGNLRQYSPTTLSLTVVDGKTKTIEPNTLGIQSAFPFPGLADWITRRILAIQSPYLWRPSVYLYSVLLACGIASWRDRTHRYGLVVAPICVQSIVLLVCNVSQDIRYQLAVFVCALLLVPWLLACAVKRRPVAVNPVLLYSNSPIPNEASMPTSPC